MVVSRIVTGLADLVWPPRCAACGVRLSPGESEPRTFPFCDPCAEVLVAVGSPMCPRCALPYEGMGPDHLCGECIRTPPAFIKLAAAYQYGGPVADAVMRLKYGARPHLARALGGILVTTCAALSSPDLVVPMPLHPRRLRKRGFNQAALLAGPLAEALGVPMVTSAITRVRDTPPQAGRNREARRENMKGAFAAICPQRVRDKRVLLLDDVVTTATTVREASTVIIAAGALSVEVIALARAY